jgi:hypothetical protein
MRPNTPNNFKRQQLEVIARLKAAQAHLIPALANLRDAQPGYPTATGGGGAPRLDAAGNPPGLDKYLGAQDPAAHDLRTLELMTSQAMIAAAVIQDIVTRWGAAQAPGHEGGLGPRRSPSGGDCVVCGTYCSGNAATNDRLRAGLCVACYSDARRSPLERGEWMLERRRALALTVETEQA